MTMAIEENKALDEGQSQSEKSVPQTTSGLEYPTPDDLGRMVCDEWVKFAQKRAAETGQPAKPSHLVGWDGLDEPNREVDRLIGDALYTYGFDQGIRAHEEVLRLHEERTGETATRLRADTEPRNVDHIYNQLRLALDRVGATRELNDELVVKIDRLQIADAQLTRTNEELWAKVAALEVENATLTKALADANEAVVYWQDQSRLLGWKNPKGEQ